MLDIQYPYLPANRIILYVPADNPFMVAGKEYARQNNTVRHVGAALVVKDGHTIGRGSVGAGFHGEIDPATGAPRGCAREKMNVPTGTGYELCKGCSYEYHSEALAISDAKKNGEDTRGADVYLWGHWWVCEHCWNTMIDAGIQNLYLLEGSERLFNKTHPDNIIGRQFE
jgi:deoxycytidylate deaminase